MGDAELEAIRKARMAELQQGRRAGGNGPTESVPRGAPSSGDNQPQQRQEAEAQDEMKRQALSTILDPDARERLSRIALVKPSKATAVQDLLIRMAQSGQVRQKISEQQLIGLLDQIEGGASGGAGSTGSGSGSAGKITFTRKKTLDDDDDDFDL